MNLTLDTLDYLIEKKYKTVHRGQWNGLKTITHLKVLWEIEDLPNAKEADCLYLYVVKEEVNAAIYPPTSAAVLSLISQSMFNRNYTENDGYFLVESQENLYTAVNQIFDIFQNYMFWQLKINDCSLLPEALLTAVSDYMNIYCGIIDKDYHMDCQTSTTLTSLGISFDEQFFMTDEEIQNLYLENPRFDETFSTSGLVDYTKTIPMFSLKENFHSYYFNIFLGDNYVSRILYLISNSDFDPRMLPLLEDCSKKISHRYLQQFQQKRSLDKKVQIRRQLHQMLNGNVPTLDDSVLLISSINWKIHDEYITFKLQSCGYSNSTQTLEYYCARMESLSPDLIAIAQNNSIYCIANLSQIKEAIDSLLPVFLRDNMLIAGCSCRYHNYPQFGLYCEEASVALAIGTELYPEFWIHHFEDYVLKYCVLQSKSHFPVSDLCHPALIILQKYDETHTDTELCRTLKCYLANQFRASAAAVQLHIHRTTFLYRMQRIEELTELNLKDTNTVLHLLLSFNMIEEK